MNQPGGNGGSFGRGRGHGPVRSCPALHPDTVSNSLVVRISLAQVLSTEYLGVSVRIPAISPASINLDMLGIRGYTQWDQTIQMSIW